MEGRKSKLKMKKITKFSTIALLAVIASAAFGNLLLSIPIALGLYIASETTPMGVLGTNVYADTVLQEARAFIKDESNKKFQLKPEFTKAIELFVKDREFTLPNLAELRSATTRATKALYLKKKQFTVGTGKSCTPTGETSGSAAVTLSWANRNVKLVTNYKQFAGNEVAQARALANDLYNAEVSLWTAVDQILVDYLEANKSGVNAGGSGTFNATDDIMEVAKARENFFYNLVTADMLKNNYNPEYLELHDTMWTAAQRQYVNQGGGNSVNTAFQFAGFEFFPSNLLTPDSGFDSVHYVVPTGGVAILDWNDPLNRSNAVSGEKAWTTMQSILRPEFTFDVFKVTSCADTTSVGGGTQDLTETWEISLNFATAVQPVATTDETPIFKYGIKSAPLS
jgi:hypothetical protein